MFESLGIAIAQPKTCIWSRISRTQAEEIVVNWHQGSIHKLRKTVVRGTKLNEINLLSYALTQRKMLVLVNGNKFKIDRQQHT